MAKNRLFPETGRTTEKLLAITADAIDGVTRTDNIPLSGDPCRIGQLPGVAVMDGDDDGKVSLFLDGVFTLLVDGVDSSGASSADANSAVKGGDALYFDEDNDPPISKRSYGGVFFGYAHGDHAVELIASGASDSIPVKVGR